MKHRLKDHNPKWYRRLEKTCIEAFTYINGFEQSITNYKDWIIKQNKDILDFSTKNHALIDENTKLKLELENIKGILNYTETYINETEFDKKSSDVF